MKRLILGALATIVILIASVFAWSEYRSRSLTLALEQLSAGDSREAVEKLLGKPNEIVRDASEFKLKSCTGVCSLEYLYLPRFLPESWSIGFDENGRLIDKYHFVSP